MPLRPLLLHRAKELLVIIGSKWGQRGGEPNKMMCFLVLIRSALTVGRTTSTSAHNRRSERTHVSAFSSLRVCGCEGTCCRRPCVVHMLCYSEFQKNSLGGFNILVKSTECDTQVQTDAKYMILYNLQFLLLKTSFEPTVWNVSVSLIVPARTEATCCTDLLWIVLQFNIPWLKMTDDEDLKVSGCSSWESTWNYLPLLPTRPSKQDLHLTDSRLRTRLSVGSLTPQQPHQHAVWHSTSHTQLQEFVCSWQTGKRAIIKIAVFTSCHQKWLNYFSEEILWENSHTVSWQ